MPTGKVKFFDGKKGYGFIEVDGGGADMFVHATALESSDIGDLSQGDKVSFESKMDPKKGKTSAVNVKKI